MRGRMVHLAGLVLLAVPAAGRGQDLPERSDRDQARPRGLLARLVADDDEDGRADASEPAAAWPNAQDPGVDLANFPNAAFTIPKGAFQFEFAPFSLYGPDNNSPNTYNTEFLLRYGLTDKVELRLFGNGYESVYNGSPRKPAMSGFSPLSFDFKMNFWDQPDDVLWLPSMGLEVYIQTEFASPGFRAGTQPGLSLLLDHALPYGFQFEWNVGVNSTIAQRDFDGVEWNLQWAFQRRFFDKLDIFTHGYINSASLPREGDGIVVGGGGIYSVSKRLSLFGSYNAGVTPEAPTTFTQLGFSLSF